MNARQITETYSVSPQIAVEDLPAIAAAGYKTVICNRPDGEVPPTHQAAAIQSAAEAAGLRFEVLPLVQETLTPDNAARQKTLVEGSDGPVLAYCRTGTRCTVIWAISEVPTRPVDDILALAAQAGYDLNGMRPALDALSAAS